MRADVGVSVKKVAYANGRVDVYGKHATYMHVLSLREDVLAGRMDEELYNDYWVTEGFDIRELDARLAKGRATSPTLTAVPALIVEPVTYKKNNEPTRFTLLEVD